jgi:hypothetical protein
MQIQGHKVPPHPNVNTGTGFQALPPPNGSTGPKGASYQVPSDPNVSAAPQDASYFRSSHSNQNAGPQNTADQVPPSHYEPQRVPMGLPTFPPITVPATQGTLFHRPTLQANVPTSPARSSGSNKSDKSDKSRQSHREDKLTEILGTLMLQNIGISEKEMFSGDVSKFYKFINRYDSLMRNVMDPQVKLNYLLMWTKRMAHDLWTT